MNILLVRVAILVVVMASGGVAAQEVTLRFPLAYSIAGADIYSELLEQYHVDRPNHRAYQSRQQDKHLNKPATQTWWYCGQEGDAADRLVQVGVLTPLEFSDECYVQYMSNPLLGCEGEPINSCAALFANDTINFPNNLVC
jgi:hypothetical protein